MAAVAYGFVIDGAPTERFTSNGGMEASVTFFGPAINRFRFLEYILGRWEYRNWVTIQGTPAGPKIPRGVCFSSLPKPYVSLSEFAPDSQTPHCFNPNYATLPYYETASHCLWPDTWEIAPADPNSRSEFISCASPPSGSPEEDPMHMPIDYSCQCYVTVHYRSKNNGCWPIAFNRYVTGVQYGGVPPIPPGTYVDIKTRASGEVQTIEGQSLKYKDPNSYGATWDGGGASVPPRLPVGIGVGSIVSTTQMDVTWSNVAMPPWDFIDSLQGRVNHEPFLGYPKESVCFMGAEWSSQGGVGCVTLYTIHYSFVIKTAQVEISATPSNGNYSDAGMVPGTTSIGVWNRRAYGKTIRYGNAIRTNYIPIEGGDSSKAPFELTDTSNNFWHLFTMRNAAGIVSNAASALICPGA